MSPKEALEETQEEVIEEPEEKPEDDTTESAEEDEDYSAAFRQVLESEEKGKETDKKPDKTDDKVDGKKKEKEENATDTEKEEKEDEKETDAEEEDEVSKTGKEVLEAEEKEEREQEEREAKENERREEAKRRSESEKIIPVNNEDVNFFINLIPDTRIPDKVTIGTGDDALDINLKEFIKDNPEVSIIGALQAQELLVNLSERGILPTTQQVMQLIQNNVEPLANDNYGLRIMVELANMGHRGIDLEALVETKKFNAWGEKTDDKTKALFRSNNPKHYALGISKYLKEEGIEKIKVDNKKKDEETRKKKEEKIKLHKSTKKSASPVLDDEEVNSTYGKVFRDVLKEDEA